MQDYISLCFQDGYFDSSVSPSGLFGSAVDGFAERFTVAQKWSQVMRHFLPKRDSSSAAPSRPKSWSTQQHTKPASMSAQPQPKALPKVKKHFLPAKCYPFPRCQGPRPKLVLDPEKQP